MSRQAERQAEDSRTLAWLRAKVSELLGYLQTHHAGDARARSVFTKLRDVQLLPESDLQPRTVGGSASWRSGKFRHSDGVLYVAARDFRGQTRTEASLLKTVVHELAHATRAKYLGEGSHSQQWKQTWLWMLELATQRLGWNVEVKCAQCTYYGLCERSQCPKCTWLTNLCKPYSGPPM